MALARSTMAFARSHWGYFFISSAWYHDKTNAAIDEVLSPRGRSLALSTGSSPRIVLRAQLQTDTSQAKEPDHQ